MADTKISALTALTGDNVASASDLLVIVDTSAGQTKKIVIDQLLPPGLILPYGGTSAPAGWILCFGQTVSQATYPALYAVLGTTFGSDSGGNFTLPDLRGRAVFGKDNMGGSAASRVTSSSGITGTTLGATGGDELLQSHNHETGAATGAQGGGATAVEVGWDSFNANQTGSTGGGASQNMPPAIILNYIIKI